MTALNLTRAEERDFLLFVHREYGDAAVNYLGGDPSKDDPAIQKMRAGWMARAALAQSPVSQDSERLDWLQERSNQRGGLLLHAGNEESGGRCGLGLRNTGRTLRAAIDQAIGVKNIAAANKGTTS